MPLSKTISTELGEYIHFGGESHSIDKWKPGQNNSALSLPTPTSPVKRTDGKLLMDYRRESDGDIEEIDDNDGDEEEYANDYTLTLPNTRRPILPALETARSNNIIAPSIFSPLHNLKQGPSPLLLDTNLSSPINTQSRSNSIVSLMAGANNNNNNSSVATNNNNRRNGSLTEYDNTTLSNWEDYRRRQSSLTGLIDAAASLQEESTSRRPSQNPSTEPITKPTTAKDHLPVRLQISTNALNSITTSSSTEQHQQNFDPLSSAYPLTAYPPMTPSGKMKTFSSTSYLHRKIINDGIDGLKMLVPIRQNERLSKAQILTRAASHIQKLEHDLQRSQRQLACYQHFYKAVDQRCTCNIKTTLPHPEDPSFLNICHQQGIFVTSTPQTIPTSSISVAGITQQQPAPQITSFSPPQHILVPRTDLFSPLPVQRSGFPGAPFINNMLSPLALSLPNAPASTPITPKKRRPTVKNVEPNRPPKKRGRPRKHPLPLNGDQIAGKDDKTMDEILGLTGGEGSGDVGSSPSGESRGDEMF